MSIPNKIRKIRQGFSLLELLTSITLLGIIMSLIYSSFFQISNLSMQVNSNLNTREELRLLMKMVLDDLQKIQYLKHFAESGQKTMPKRETGLIAERVMGFKNVETGELEEVSKIHFHTAIKSRFYPEEKMHDPELHEVSYSLEENLDTKSVDFIRREDFFLDNNLREGGKSYVLSQAVMEFDLELLESETELADGGFEEKWTKEWNSNENKCNKPMLKGIFCLPRSIKLSMTLKGEDEKTISDTQVANLCIPPCNQEIFD